MFSHKIGLDIIKKKKRKYKAKTTAVITPRYFLQFY